MKRLASLLNDTFGADITCDIGDGLPVRIHGKELYPANSGVTVRSAQIKSALLLASLFTKDRVEIHEDVISRDHTEQMMEAFGLCDGVLSPEHIHYTIPGDFSASAYFIVASIMLESTVTIGNVSLNPTRTRLLDILKECGLQVEITNRKSNWGEDYGDLTVDGSTFAGFDSYDFTEKDVSLCIDELPLVAVLAALSKGKVSIHHAAELRRKESDRITAICTNLCAMGVECEEYEDGFTVTGGVVLRKAVINSFGDHRIAMAFAILGLSSKAEVTIPDADVVSISFPGFFKQLAAVAGEERVQIR
jgi:3-phosphoshikimate 1-carboxyvinyltransferase